MEWIAHDVVARDALPEWTRGVIEVLPAQQGFACTGGVVLRAERRRRFVAVPWDQLFGVARTKKGAFVLLARRPPRPPWIIVTQAAADRIERMRDARLRDRTGYRTTAVQRRNRLLPDEILRSVIAGDSLPGAIEIRRGMRTHRVHGPVVTSIFLGGALGGVGTGIAGPIVGKGIALLAAGGAITAAAMVAVGAAAYGVGRLIDWRENRRRVLVLTPDAYVGGLDGEQVRAIPWDDIDAFRRGTLAASPALEVVGTDGSIVARVPAIYLGVDLEVLLALSHAYRERAIAE